MELVWFLLEGGMGFAQRNALSHGGSAHQSM